MKIINKHIIEKNTKGAYNTFGFLANSIRFDESTIIAKSDNLSEAVDWEVEQDKKGGIIVFSTDVNAIKLSDNALVNWVKQKVHTISNRVGYNKKIDKIASNNKDVYAWTVGKYLHGRYKAKNGQVFDENSLSVEFIGVPTDTLINLAEEICKAFEQESVLVKSYTEDKIFFVNAD